MAAHGEQGFAALPQRQVGWPMGVAGRVRLPRFLIMRVRGGSGFGRACGVQGLMKKEEENNTAFPCCTSRGRRKGNSVVQNDTVLPPLFFFLHETAPFWTKRVVSFKYGTTRQLPNQSLIYLLFISIASLTTSISALIVGRLFHFGPWSLIYAIWPSTDQ